MGEYVKFQDCWRFFFGVSMHISEWQVIFCSDNAYFGLAMQSGNAYFGVAIYM